MPLYGLYPQNVHGGSGGAGTSINYLTDTIKAALLTSAYTPNQNTDQWWSDVVANESSGTGYTAGGQALTSKSIAYNSSTKTTTFSAANSSWPTSTVSAQYNVVYKSTGTNSTSNLILYNNFGSTQSTTGGTFAIDWNAAGIWTVTVT